MADDTKHHLEYSLHLRKYVEGGAVLPWREHGLEPTPPSLSSGGFVW